MRSMIKKVLPRTLFARSLLILIVPVLLIQVITTFVFFDRHWGRMTTHLSYAVAGEIAMIVNGFDPDGDMHSRRFVQGAQRYLELETRYLGAEKLPAPARFGMGEIWENIVSSTLENELSAMIDRPFVLSFDFANKEIRVYVEMDEGVLLFLLPQRRLFSSSGYIFLLWVFGASMLLLVISVMFMRNQIRPIRRLAVAAERFGKGRDVPSFRASGAKEVRQASEAFIEMQRRIKRQVQQRTDMLAGISHDLRTPLTRLKLELEMLSAQYDVSAMKDDISQMERMIGGYLDFVRGEGREAVTTIDAGEILQKLAGDASRVGAQVHLDEALALRLRVRPLAFERAVGNIISNAAKYSANIYVHGYVEGEKAYILVEDDGPGIPDHMREEVFKPFKRVDDSRNAETGGVGLGLSIAMDIMQSHGGMIELDQSSYGGLKVILRLPL